MITTGVQEPFTGGSVQSYFSVGAAISNFESRSGTSIQKAVASGFPGKTVEEVILEGRTVWHEEVWIDFKEFTEPVLLKEIADAERVIADKGQDAWMVSSYRGILDELQRSLAALRASKG